MPYAPPRHNPYPDRPRVAWQKKPGEPKRVTGRALQARRKRIAARDRYTCYVCHRPTIDGEVDHKIPLCDNGSDEDTNLGWICKAPCHVEKTKRETRGTTTATERRRDVYGVLGAGR